MYIKTER